MVFLLSITFLGGWFGINCPSVLLDILKFPEWNEDNFKIFKITRVIYRKKSPETNIWLLFDHTKPKKHFAFKVISFDTIQDGLFRGWSQMGGGGGKKTPKNLSQKSCSDETWHNYTNKNQKIYESRNTPPEFCWHQYFSLEISKFCYVKKYRYRLHFYT